MRGRWLRLKAEKSGVGSIRRMAEPWMRTSCRRNQQNQEKYGRIDILINNAGISDSTPISSYTAEKFAKIMQLNVNAVMNGVLAVVDIMKEQGGGCILNTSSMVSFLRTAERRWIPQANLP